MQAPAQTEAQPFNAAGDAWLKGGGYGGSDPFAEPLSSLIDVKKATVDLRRGFVRKVYGILALQLLLTSLIAVPFQFLDDAWLASNQWLLWVSVALGLALVCALSCSPNLARNYPANEICLFFFTAFTGVVVGFTSAIYTWQSVILAVGITMAVVVGLTVYAFFTSTDFTGIGAYLFGALNAVLAFALTLLIMGLCGVSVEVPVVLLDLFSVLLFVMFIVYDTQLMLGSWGGHKQEFSLDDYVGAALNLYLDIINLFTDVLRLVGTHD